MYNRLFLTKLIQEIGYFLKTRLITSGVKLLILTITSLSSSRTLLSLAYSSSSLIIKAEGRVDCDPSSIIVALHLSSVQNF